LGLVFECLDAKLAVFVKSYDNCNYFIWDLVIKRDLPQTCLIYRFTWLILIYLVFFLLLSLSSLTMKIVILFEFLSHEINFEFFHYSIMLLLSNIYVVLIIILFFWFFVEKKDTIKDFKSVLFFFANWHRFCKSALTKATYFIGINWSLWKGFINIFWSITQIIKKNPVFEISKWTHSSQNRLIFRP